MSSSQFKVYLSLEDGCHVRRFEMKQQVKFDPLKLQIRGLYNSLRESSFKVYWEDEEGDMIEITSDTELRAAQSCSPTPLQLYIETGEQQPSWTWLSYWFFNRWWNKHSRRTTNCWWCSKTPTRGNCSSHSTCWWCSSRSYHADKPCWYRNSQRRHPHQHGLVWLGQMFRSLAVHIGTGLEFIKAQIEEHARREKEKAEQKSETATPCEKQQVPDTSEPEGACGTTPPGVAAGAYASAPAWDCLHPGETNRQPPPPYPTDEAPPTYSEGEPRLYPTLESDENSADIVRSLEVLRGMGFKDDGGWLTRLVVAKHGDIDRVLEEMNPR